MGYHQGAGVGAFKELHRSSHVCCALVCVWTCDVKSGGRNREARGVAWPVLGQTIDCPCEKVVGGAVGVRKNN